MTRCGNSLSCFGGSTWSRGMWCRYTRYSKGRECAHLKVRQYLISFAVREELLFIAPTWYKRLKSPGTSRKHASSSPSASYRAHSSHLSALPTPKWRSPSGLPLSPAAKPRHINLPIIPQRDARSRTRRSEVRIFGRGTLGVERIWGSVLCRRKEDGLADKIVGSKGAARGRRCDRCGRPLAVVGGARWLNHPGGINTAAPAD